MKVIAISDLHGYFPEIEPCDLLLIAGDICPMDGSYALRAHESGAQRNWVRDHFIPWCEEQPAKQVVWIGGNHDFGVDLPGAYRSFREVSPKWVRYLRDEAIEFMGNTIYGCPWCPNLQNWAFYASDRAWEHISEDIPTDTDILVLHSPPRGSMLDGGHPEWASPEIFQHIVDRIKPKLVVCGHLHEGYGLLEVRGIKIANVALKDDDYKIVNKPMVFTLDEENDADGNDA